MSILSSDSPRRNTLITFPTVNNGKTVKHELQVTSSNSRVRRLKPRVARLKARVARLKARVGRLKARVEAIKPGVK